MITIDLSGKTILLTGALGAIAEFVVKRLVEAGATLVLTDLKGEEEAKATLDGWGIAPSTYVYFSADVSDSKQVDRVVKAAFEKFPKMDIALGHAGGTGLHPFENTPEQEFERIFRFNFFSQTYLARAILAYWTKHRIAGHLIFTTSYVSRTPHTQISAYAAAKAALDNFARSLAMEYADRKIRVNLVSPANVAAGAALKVYEEDPPYREFVNRVMLGPRNTPQSVADTFVFLCSSLANEISGHVFDPDYGSAIGNRL
jgi:NAD(P)-dependent dehydrogenase (short-subunit alcohol dehydrogenase family)